MHGTAPSPEDLRHLSEAIVYELESVKYAADRLVADLSGQRPLEDVGHRNALIETELVHVRQLVAFLKDDRGKARDAVALDFVRDPDAWRNARPKLPDNLRPQVIDAIGAEVAHLTYRRAKPERDNYPWSPYRLYTSLEPIVTAFLDQVDSARVAPDFLDRMRAALPPPTAPVPPGTHNPGGYSVGPVPTQGLTPKRLDSL